MLMGTTVTTGIDANMISADTYDIRRNGVNASTGAATTVMGNANPATNARWIPIEHQGVEFWIPVWADATP